jgi:glycosyltransferase involved in cell wall biosynthesis
MLGITSSPTAMSSSDEQPAVSFVVIAYNEAATIERALDSILAQDGLASHEVIVVDDGSTDETAARVAALARRDSDVRLIRLEQNRGRGFARDTGIRLARGRVIATVDADIVLPPGWLSECQRELASADAVGGTALPDGDVAYICSRFRLEPRPVAHTTTVTGSNAAYRRELFDRVSFDPALRDGEDVALNHALLALGARILTVPGLTVQHQESKDLRQTVAWLYQSGRGATRQLYRYRQLRRPDIVFAGWLLSGLGAAALRRRGRGRGRAAALPMVYVGAAATAHVARAFAWERRYVHRLLGAVVLDMALLGAYFAGRLTGVAAPLRSPRRAMP